MLIDSIHWSFESTQHKAFTLSIGAVLGDNKEATVWIKTGVNTFANKMVQTGLETDDRIEITSGMQHR